MLITRRFTREGQDPFAALNFQPRTSRIVNPNGSVVFERRDIMIPDGWSQVAVDILAQKYFRRAGVAAKTVKVAEEGGFRLSPRFRRGNALVTKSSLVDSRTLRQTGVKV